MRWTARIALIAVLARSGGRYGRCGGGDDERAVVDRSADQRRVVKTQSMTSPLTPSLFRPRAHQGTNDIDNGTLREVTRAKCPRRRKFEW